MEAGHISSLLICWITLTGASVNGLQCPSCAYVTTTGDSSAIIKTILDVFQDSKCKDKITRPTAGVDEETCPEVSGKVARCSLYKGTVTATLLGQEFPLQIYQRGCYHSSPANVPSNSCHNRNAINEDKSVLQQVLDRGSTFLSSLEVARFEGQLCICSDTYCQTSGVPQGAVLSPWLFGIQMLIALIYAFQ